MHNQSMEFIRRLASKPVSLGILSGTFNPPTRAHLALGEAGLALVDHILFVIPRVLPHKTYEGIGFADRLQMVEAATADQERFGVAVTQGGLFLDIARECHEALGREVAVKFLCGRDAAERVVNWEYGRPGAFLELLQEFELLVAGRKGAFEVPAGMRGRIHPLPMPDRFDEISATDVRTRIARGEPWEHLVPDKIVALIRRLYGK